jgi:D-tyrosyl-tRNA(Tyr) deacylase
VTVEASDNCYYSIDYTMVVGDRMYSPIERGLFVDVNLKKNEEQRLLYRHQSKDSFRILTLHQSGTVAVKARTYKNVKEFIDDTNSKNKFTWTGQDFLRI